LAFAFFVLERESQSGDARRTPKKHQETQKGQNKWRIFGTHVWFSWGYSP
jgi:hypothetical protein